MAKRKNPPQASLFPLSTPVAREPEVRQLRFPIWSENKARLIERYLFYFVLVTRHGTYIDGFAGPQQEENEGTHAGHETWSAKLVLESRPRWLRNFHLFEADARQLKRLRAMVSSQVPRTKKEPKRLVEVHEGDFNVEVLNLLKQGLVKQKEAAFCLLDQRTFECKWTTLKALAAYKTTAPKIELFYFLPNSWLVRALAATKEESVIEEWWGRSDWPSLRDMKPNVRALAFAERFKKELGYASVKPWPIRERQDGGNIMYFMIHATDHPDAPGLMRRAYEKAVEPKEPIEQLSLQDIATWSRDAKPLDLGDGDVET